MKLRLCNRLLLAGRSVFRVRCTELATSIFQPSVNDRPGYSLVRGGSVLGPYAENGLDSSHCASKRLTKSSQNCGAKCGAVLTHAQRFASFSMRYSGFMETSRSAVPRKFRRSRSAGCGACRPIRPARARSCREGIAAPMRSEAKRSTAEAAARRATGAPVRQKFSRSHRRVRERRIVTAF